MKSQVQQLLESTPEDQPCFRVYGGLVVSVRLVKAINTKCEAGIKIQFTDGREAFYSGPDIEDVRSSILCDFIEQNPKPIVTPKPKDS